MEKIIIIDDDENMCMLLRDFFKRKGYEVEWFTTPSEGQARIESGKVDVLITDVNMPGGNGIDICKSLSKQFEELPIIIITAFGSMETAISALRAGAYDFITKPLDLNLIEFSVKRAIKHFKLHDEVKSLTSKLERLTKYDQMIGQSSGMVKLFQQIEKIAPADISVLITGESGTGKELVAKSIHNRSRRKDKPFIALNCAALPDTLFESELFGVKKGAFTDAKDDRKGLFLQADGGTLFLDELGSFPFHLQAKLLRALEEKKLRPVGGDFDVDFDVRIISATNSSIENLIKEGAFREDLFYRLNAISLEIPPLRDREKDIVLLTDSFLEYFNLQYNKNISGLSSDVYKFILNYKWPGNVRELKNTIERAVVLCDGSELLSDDFPDKLKDKNILSSGFVMSEDLISLEEMEKNYILHVYNKVSRNLTRASDILQINRSTLYRKLKSWEQNF